MRMVIQNSCFVSVTLYIVVSRRMEGMDAIHLTHNSMFEIRLCARV